MDSITIDGLHEDAFRLAIEDQLRRGYADTAARRLRTLIEPFAGDHKMLPARFLHVSHEDIEISGWEELDQGFRKYDRAEQPVTAICLSFGDPEGGGPAPDGAGLLSLTVETSYFSDEAFPFSESDRNDLLDGYSSFGCQWAGDCEGVDHALSFRGVDDLYGALAGLEQRLLSTSSPDPDEIKAGTIASCYLSVLFHQALRDTAARRRLGRPLCVMTANNGVYPSFDAPVLSCDEYLAGGKIVPVPATHVSQPVAEDSIAHAHVSADEDGVEAVEEASLLSIGIKRTAKQPVLALAEGEADSGMDAMASAALGGTASPPPVSPLSPQWDEEPAEYDPLPAPADVFEDPASFVEIEAAPASAVEPEPEPALDQAPEPSPEASEEEESVSFAVQPANDIEPDAGEPAEETAAEITSFEETAQAQAQPAAFDPDTWEPDLPVAPAQPERAMGDTEWPARPEEPEVQPLPELFEVPEAAVAPAAPPPPAPEHQGHSLRARLSVAEDEPEPGEGLLSRLVSRLLALFRR
ncbi:hypothetical protein [Novosphingobium sp. TH158]|uniref:hypothetical protein n=1 Tax=Novosphingobium sp. TH158 TaxID=2067455 RepID=UPI000C7E0B0A|nr:hypothetical protein [Novosphingobium sp. TH158]PLK25624.1 hypothetical protein C0V78_00980 [Novosphingobium sp. TH158]